MEEEYRILIVDDEIEYQEVLTMILEDNGYYVSTAFSGVEALKKLKKEKFHLVLTDLMMEGIDGVKLLEQIKSKFQNTQVIMVTGYGSIQNAVETTKKGAAAYFIKGNDPEELLKEIEKLKKEKIILEQKQDSYSIETQNREFKDILDVVEKAAKSNVSIFITGESGVGKEVLARYIHNISGRHGKFVAVNCQALTENLLESELFGHEKGSFTGALDKRIGRFEEAKEGTLFLDEIGEIPPAIQTKLLRALETKTIERIGSNKEIAVDLRFISATNRDITEEIKKGNFREDLYYRINTIFITIPPLRKRKEDLPHLINFFFKKCEKELNKKIVSIEQSVMNFLLNYDYPGNIRELKNIIERIIVLSEDGNISSKYLPCYKSKIIKNIEDEKISLDVNNIVPLKEYKKEFEAEYIKEVLKLCKGNITKSASFLGISRRQLFNKVNEYELK